MTTKHKIIISSLAIALTATALYGGIKRAYADDSKNQNLIEYMTQKLNLNKNDVDKAVSEYRGMRQQQNRTTQETKLNEAVSSGKITEAQKTTILQKIEEMNKNRPNFSNMTRDEIQAYRETHRDTLHTWAEENNIDLNEILGGPFGQKARGMGDRGFGQNMGPGKSN